MKSEQHPSDSTAVPAVEERGPAPIRVLCVEDDRSYFLLIRQFLLHARFGREVTVTHCATLAEAESRLRAGGDTPVCDVVLLDLSLPDSFGQETFDRIHDVAPTLPIIVLSGNDDHEVAVAMVQRGAQDFVPKGALTSDLLFRSILYAGERNRLRQHLSELNARLVKTTEELRTTQMQLIQAEKLESLGRIAASVAHEIQNPLGTLLMGVAFFGNKRAELGEADSDVLNTMQDAIERAARIVREMLTFSRSESLQLVAFQANQLTLYALRMVRTELIKRKIVLVEDLALELPDVRADADKLSQVLINLIMNAAQATRDGGTIEVRTGLTKMPGVPHDEGLRELDRLRTDDPVVMIEVRDHGPGIPEELMSRIFEPFFTTKPTGEGTGLGLSVSKKIVELHRGHLELVNVDNPRGLRARVLLPIATDASNGVAGGEGHAVVSAVEPF